MPGEGSRARARGPGPSIKFAPPETISTRLVALIVRILRAPVKALQYRLPRGYAKNQAAIRLGKDWRPVLVLRRATILSRGSRHRDQKAARLYCRPPPSSSAWRPGSRKQSACVQVL
jgi:hypothetical protein